MISRIGNTLSLLSILVATSAAAQQPVADPLPHIAMMSHQTMTYNGKVVYEADVDQNEPNPRAFVLGVKIDEVPIKCASTIKNVAASKEQDEEGKVTMLSCVVTELSANGQARADIVYTIQDKKHNVSKSGHLEADLQVGKEYKTPNNGSQLTLLLQTY
jgi:hypothetical protein